MNQRNLSKCILPCIYTKFFLEERRPQIDVSDKKIYPENKFEPFRRHSLFIEIAQSPAMKAIVYVIALIILATSPVLQNEIFVIISKLLGL